ncbi:transposase, partial [Xanthomonas oryzae]
MQPQQAFLLVRGGQCGKNGSDWVHETLLAGDPSRNTADWTMRPSLARRARWDRPLTGIYRPNFEVTIGKRGLRSVPRPQQNAYVARYNRTVRYAWLARPLFDTIEQVQDKATRWSWT